MSINIPTTHHRNIEKIKYNSKNWLGVFLEWDDFPSFYAGKMISSAVFYAVNNSF